MKPILEYIREMIRQAQRRNAWEIVIHAPMLQVLDALKRQVKDGDKLERVEKLFGYQFIDSKEVWLEIDGKPNRAFFIN